MHQRTGAVEADGVLYCPPVHRRGLRLEEPIDLQHLVDGSLFEAFWSAVEPVLSIIATCWIGICDRVAGWFQFPEMECVADAVFEFEDNGIVARAWD